MAGFAADWLALRAPADARARNRQVADALTEAFAGHQGLTILDLGAGTGNNMAMTAPLLPMPQRWILVDSDPALLDRAVAPAGVEIIRRIADLADGLAPLLQTMPDLVTASALFDLAGRDWIADAAAALARARLPLHAVLSYTGSEIWRPSHPLDDKALAAFHADQQRDKGLGPALGPQAHRALAEALSAMGYRIVEGASDWVLERPRDAALIGAMAEGSAAAIAPTLGPDTDTWLAARRTATWLRVSHSDLLALPPD